MISLLSCSLPLSPRETNIRQTFSRRSRRAEKVRNGATLERVLRIAHWPVLPRDAAASRGKTGQWAILNTRSSVAPFLTFSARRDLREKVWRMFVSRGDNGNEHDNNEIIKKILKLRAQRAKLLGYPTH